MKNAELATEIGRRIKALREARGETQGPVAVRAGCTVAELSRYEHGRKLPDLPRLQSLAAALGVSFAHLVPEAMSHPVSNVGKAKDPAG